MTGGWANRRTLVGWVFVALTYGFIASWVSEARASPIYGQTMAGTYVSEARITGDTACLYCHPTVAGMVATKTFGRAMVARGLAGGSDRTLFVSLMDALMGELDSYGGDPLEPNSLLDSDYDTVPDALEIRWGSNPSDPDSKLERDPNRPDAYLTVGTQAFAPVRYGCGAQLAPGSLPGGATTATAALLLVLWRVRQRGQRRRGTL